jgi:hypothetical protein
MTLFLRRPSKTERQPGRILAEAATVPGRFVSITGKVNVSREETFYTAPMIGSPGFASLCSSAY